MNFIYRFHDANSMSLEFSFLKDLIEILESKSSLIKEAGACNVSNQIGRKGLGGTYERDVTFATALENFGTSPLNPSFSTTATRIAAVRRSQAYHRRLVVRASSSFKNRSFFFLDLGASVPGIHLLHRAPAAVRRALSHHRLRLVVADSSNPPPSSELCSSPGLCLRHDSTPLFSDCSVEKPISIPVSFLRVQRAEAQPRKKP
ncbi:hypothetical protein AHAS_Ahas20G0272900 [Arachis hypogaea]